MKPIRFLDWRQDAPLLALDYGIVIPEAVAGRQPVGYIEDAWLRDLALAMDAQPTLITSPNAGIPAVFTNLIDPEVIRVIVTPMRAAEIYGEVKKGDWTILSTQFPVVEAVGTVTSYGDNNNNGNVGANINWVPRQSYHYQTVSQWGERELDMYGAAQINYVSEINVAGALILSKFQNQTYFFGVTGLQNYGALNDPSLIAPILPTVKAAGGYTWPAGTAAEIYSDVLKLYGQLQTQMGGNIDMDANMTLAMSTTLYPSLAKVSAFNVTARQTVTENFPNLKIKTAPEFSLPAGELMQLIVDDVDGVRSTYTAFTEKMRAHPVIPDLSSFKQKKSGGTWGAIMRRPIAIAQMQGM